KKRIRMKKPMLDFAHGADAFIRYNHAGDGGLQGGGFALFFTGKITGSRSGVKAREGCLGFCLRDGAD
ncbi:hypothetical protein, partial [Neisseria sp. P0014.S006]|uniref:hypothetical protein n=1 Tax=Neisseria sp. P0014.S006 TaxID=3436752 RepID=UPI003F803D2C